MNEIVTYVSIIECDNCYNPIFTPLGCPSRSFGVMGHSRYATSI